jgi:hypothetical protein
LAGEGDTSAQLLLVEYEQIKSEQRSRIGFRDNLLYASLVSVAGVVAAALNTKGRADLLLILPPVSVLLGWTYLVNDEKVSAIGRYIRTELAPRFASMVTGATAFGWEHAHRRDENRRTRKLLQLGVDLATFCLSPAAAIVIYWINGPITVAFLLVSFAETAAIATLAAQIIQYADLHHRSSVDSD